MLSLFPQILFLAPLGTMLLRVSVALAFLYIAYVQFKRRKEIGQIKFPIVGSGTFWADISAVVIAALGIALLIGYATQLVALLGLITSIKHGVFARRYPRAVPLCRLEYFFMAIICISLIFSGAGAFAFDLPL